MREPSLYARAIEYAIEVEAEDRDPAALTRARDRLRKAALRYRDTPRPPGRPRGARDAYKRRKGAKA